MGQQCCAPGRSEQGFEITAGNPYEKGRTESHDSIMSTRNMETNRSLTEVKVAKTGNFALANSNQRGEEETVEATEKPPNQEVNIEKKPTNASIIEIEKEEEKAKPNLESKKSIPTPIVKKESKIEAAKKESKADVTKKESVKATPVITVEKKESVKAVPTQPTPKESNTLAKKESTIIAKKESKQVIPEVKKESTKAIVVEKKQPEPVKPQVVEKAPEDKIILSDYSKSFFEELNLIRSDPEKFYDELSALISKIVLEDGKPILKLEHVTYRFKESLENIKSSHDFLKSLTPVNKPQLLEDIRHVSLWSEKLYQNSLLHLKNLKEGEQENVKEFHAKLAKNYQYECECYNGYFSGFDEPRTMALLFLMDNKKDREVAFCHSFDYGACATIKSQNQNKLKSIIVFVDVIYPGERERREGKPVTTTPAPQVPVLTLDHPAFDCINYKDLIIGGDFDIDGNVINAVFELSNGEKRSESIPM